MRIKIWILLVILCFSTSASAQGLFKKGVKGAKPISKELPKRDIPPRKVPGLTHQLGRGFITESQLLQLDKIDPNVIGKPNPIKWDKLSSYEVTIFMREKMLRVMRNIPHRVLTQPKEVTDEWWWEYIGRIVEDQQMFQQGKERIEHQFDNNKDSQPNEMENLFRLIPIRHDIKQERDRNTSYIFYYAYGYELAA